MIYFYLYLSVTSDFAQVEGSSTAKISMWSCGLLCTDFAFKMHLKNFKGGDSLSDDKYLAASLLSPVTHGAWEDGDRTQETEYRPQTKKQLRHSPGRAGSRNLK